MQTTMLQRAREGRLNALKSLAEFREENIFLTEHDDRRAPNHAKVQFSSARSCAANLSSAPDLRQAA